MNGDALSRRLVDCRLSTRCYRCLVEKEGLETIGDLLQQTESDLLSRKNFGHISLCQIKRMLKRLGLNLAESYTPFSLLRREGKVADVGMYMSVGIVDHRYIGI